MKIILFLLLLTLPLAIFSQESKESSQKDVIELTNKREKELEMQNTREKDSQKTPEVNNESSKYSGLSIFPNSIYIGELGNLYSIDKNRNRVISRIESFLQGLSDNTGYSEQLSEDFKFLFNQVYLDLFTEDLISWLIGYPIIEELISVTEIELHFRSKIYTGFIYLDKNSGEVVDIQLDIEEEIIFDPSSPY